MVRGKYGCDKYNAVYLIPFEKLQIGKLLVNLIFRVGEQQTVALPREDFGNTGGNAANGFRIDFWKNYTDYASFTGSQNLGVA